MELFSLFTYYWCFLLLLNEAKIILFFREIKYPSNNTFYTAILTIKQVSAEDFKHKFMCKGSGFYSANNTTVTLKQRG